MKKEFQIFFHSFCIQAILPLVVQSFDSYCDLLSISVFNFFYLIVVARESDQTGTGEWQGLNFDWRVHNFYNIAYHGEIVEGYSSNTTITVILVYSEFYIDHQKEQPPPKTKKPFLARTSLYNQTIVHTHGRRTATNTHPLKLRLVSYFEFSK